jgi:hypothetical protein
LIEKQPTRAAIILSVFIIGPGIVNLDVAAPEAWLSTAACIDYVLGVSALSPKFV